MKAHDKKNEIASRVYEAILLVVFGGITVGQVLLLQSIRLPLL